MIACLFMICFVFPICFFGTLWKMNLFKLWKCVEIFFLISQKMWAWHLDSLFIPPKIVRLYCFKPIKTCVLFAFWQRVYCVGLLLWWLFCNYKFGFSKYVWCDILCRGWLTLHFKMIFFYRYESSCNNYVMRYQPMGKMGVTIICRCFVQILAWFILPLDFWWLNTGIFGFNCLYFRKKLCHETFLFASIFQMYN